MKKHSKAELLQVLGQVSISKTILWNLKLFPLKTALKMPLLIGRHTKLRLKRGSIRFSCPVRSGMVTFGVGGSQDLWSYESSRSYLGIFDDGVLCFHGKARFARHTSCYIVGGQMEVGTDFSSNIGCRFSVTEGLSIGDKCLVGGNVVMRDSDGHKLYPAGNPDQCVIKEKIRIGNHVWMANYCTILKGVSIPDECVVGYGSLVTRKFTQPHAVIGGCPAREIKNDIEWQI